MHVAGSHTDTALEAFPRYKKLYQEFVRDVLEQEEPQAETVVDAFHWDMVENWNAAMDHDHVRYAIRKMPVC